ncbi:MAG: GH36-type glycosyl hydrolase domain-containing protein, partial [Vicinamibacterales bacterium]
MLAHAYRTLAEDVRHGAFVTPATEWFLDNFHLIASEIVEIREHLPRRYYRELPALVTREHSGEARDFAIAVELLRYSDSRLDLPQLTHFLNSYQRVAPLTIGELWAWPSMLKLALIENLRRLADEILISRTARRAADNHVVHLDAAPPDTPVVIPEAAHDAYIVQMLHRAREYDARRSPLRAALEAHLNARHAVAEDVVRIEHQRQAASQASVANAITSLRLCTTIDWRQYVESVSLVDNVLRRDPLGIYAQTDFLSRDRLRQAVEELAEPAGEAQIRVALKAVESARQAATQGHSRAAAHVGYYLVGKGRGGLEIDLAYQPKPMQRLRRWLRRHAAPAYLGSIAFVTFSLIALALLPFVTNPIVSGFGRIDLRATPLQLLVAAVLLLIPASDFAIAFVQKIVMRLVRPERLPRLELLGGVPDESKTMVVVPTLITTIEGIEHLIDHLEVIAIANRDPHIHFAILSDFADAEAAQMPGDQELLDAARHGIESLNRRMGGEPGPRFLLLHRNRLWNEREQVWMGWERKRGKLEELNRLMRGATDTSFGTRVGPADALAGVKYVITLDSDTQLPRDTARKLIGIISHPLNRAVVHPTLRRVTEGYAILQPRVSVSVASAAGSVFARTYAGHTGVDPYTTAVSDVYQDLFNEGIFTGKGLYDVDAFVASLEGRVPENALLSHDLFEGLFARIALVTDAEVVDDYPSNVLTHARRQHRWVRGDWQILSCLLPVLPTRHGFERNRLPLISRWKVLDNLRRSLVAPALMALLASAWTWLPGSPLGWTLAALAVLGFPMLPPFVHLATGPRPQQPFGVFLHDVWEEVKTAGAQVLLEITLLAYHAFEMVHAIVLTLVRLVITQRRLLEWETAAATAARAAGLLANRGPW